MQSKFEALSFTRNLFSYRWTSPQCSRRRIRPHHFVQVTPRVLHDGNCTAVQILVFFSLFSNCQAHRCGAFIPITCICQWHCFILSFTSWICCTDCWTHVHCVGWFATPRGLACTAHLLVVFCRFLHLFIIVFRFSNWSSYPPHSVFVDIYASRSMLLALNASCKETVKNEIMNKSNFTVSFVDRIVF